MSDVMMLIDGEWRDGRSFLPIATPDGQSITRLPIAMPGDVEEAVAAARKALPDWRAIGVAERASLLEQVADRLVKEYGSQGEETPLKSLISSEVGKRLPEADVEVIESSDMIRFFATNAPALLAPVQPQLDKGLWPTKESEIVHEPVGVVAVIKPWNYPLELPIWSIAPALVAGNTVVFKPSEYASMVGEFIVRMFDEAGIPAGVLNLITGADSAGRALVESPGVDFVSFTGSVNVGREIAQSCASNLRRYSLELGGNDAALVLSDADIDLATNGLVWGAFCNSGQVCVGIKRAIVVEDVYDAVVSAVLARTKELRAGADYGPMISDEQASAVEAFIGDAVQRGARIACGGKRGGDHGGNYFEPTVILNVPSDARLMNEECFGPVLPIISVPTTDDAVALANSGNYGLGASIWTADLEAGHLLAGRIEAGMVWVNDVNVAFPETPWGGVKQSGQGVELSAWGLYEYTVKKHISVDRSGAQRRDWWYPY